MICFLVQNVRGCDDAVIVALQHGVIVKVSGDHRQMHDV